MTSYYDYLQKTSSHFRMPAPPPPTSTVFDKEFTPTDFRTVLRDWKIKNGFPAEDEIRKITEGLEYEHKELEGDLYGGCDADEYREPT